MTSRSHQMIHRIIRLTLALVFFLVGTAALTECGGVWYEHINDCDNQIRRLRTSQPSLLRKVGQGLGLYVEGTIPITHHGNRYYIPVRIMLPYNFPEVPPIIHVVPAG